jgi:hypothetical protein
LPLRYGCSGQSPLNPPVRKPIEKEKAMSDFLRLNGRDFSRGLVVAVLVALLTQVEQIVESQSWSLAQLKAAGMAALLAGIGYVLKNLLTNSKDQLLTREPTADQKPTQPLKPEPDPAKA